MLSAISSGFINFMLHADVSIASPSGLARCCFLVDDDVIWFYGLVLVCAASSKL